MVENRWQMILGGFVLLLMLLIGSCSIGVYVGRHGLSREGLHYAPEQAAGRPAGLPPTGTQSFPSLQPDLVGLVREIHEDRLDLATRAGLRSISINQATKVFNSQAQPLALDSMRSGDLIGVYGQIQNLNGNQFLAVRIVLLPKQLLEAP